MGDSCRFTAFPFPCGKAASDSLALMYQISCRFRRATQHAVSSKTFVWGVVGIVLVADGVYYTVAWFQARCGRLQSSAAQLTSAGDKPFNEERDAPSVRQYWVELSDAILKAPRTPLKDGERRIALPVAAEDIADGVLPDAVRIIWEDQVRYLLDRREVLLLLRSAVRGPSMTTKDDIISAASLAFL
ncbi:putative ABC transporter, partial [Trypanosoma cruzi]